MKILLKLEELAMFFVALICFLFIGNTLFSFLILIFLPDLGMLGYLINPAIGAFTYNLLHHKGIALLLILAGYFGGVYDLLMIGLIIFAHSSGDRFLGFGLKYPDSFNNTSLGVIGNKKEPIIEPSVQPVVSKDI